MVRALKEKEEGKTHVVEEERRLHLLTEAREWARDAKIGRKRRGMTRQIASEKTS